MKVSNFYPQAMEELISESGWRVTDGVIDLSQCETTVTEDEIINKAQELLNEWQRLSYQRDRLKEYPSMNECIHAILDDDLEALQTKRSAVKTKYPKPE